MRFFAAVIWVLLNALPAKAETVFTVRGPEYAGDTRMDYDYDVMKLALDLTVDSHGPYTLQKTPIGVNFKRAVEFAKQGRFPNFFLRNMVSEQSMNDLIPVIFPVERGITGFRVALIKSNLQDEIGNIEDISDLRKFDIIQGIGWPDNLILRANGLRVLTGPSFPRIWEMLVNDRAQLFLRGVNEISAEMQSGPKKMTISIEQNLVFHYPFPRFLFTSPENKSAVNRIKAGLIKACNNGSFVKLWRSYFQKSLDELKLDNRKMIHLRNPYLNAVSDLLRELDQLPAECREIRM